MRRKFVGGVYFSGEGGAGGGGGETPPPSNTPPSNTPPSNTPPSNTPPSNTPPSNTPPSNTPPSNTPPSAGLEERLEALIKEHNELKERYAQDIQNAQHEQNVRQLEIELKNANDQFGAYGFDAVKTINIIKADPRLNSENPAVVEAFKATYSGAMGLVKYWSENKDIIAAQGSTAGATMGEDVKKIYEKREKGEPLSRAEEIKLTNHLISQYGGK